MMSRFFIDRPIFAAVCSIVIILAGVVSFNSLPLAQFPSVTPPTVQVSCNYPGASAKEVADSVAAPIEQQVNGVEGIMYMSSQCANDGSYNLTVTFQQGVNLDMAQVLVQNRVNLAVPLLPEVIRSTGVTTLKQSPDILMGLAISSPTRQYDQLFLSNFALLQIKDELARVPGVGNVFLFGQRDYSMRIWVDPDALASRGLSAGDVVLAVREQNTQVATGAVGQEPIHGAQMSQITLNTLGRLSDVEQFENIIVKTGNEGRIVRIKDVGRVELGARNQNVRVRLDGRDTVFLAIFQTPDANALDLHKRIMDKMESLKPAFPDGVEYEIGFDTTPYTRESIHEVEMTLFDAIFLVAIVVLLFLQNWRSAIIPLVAVPVAIIGTFAAMLLIGFSLNNLTLFGLVLAIGIVVDDAIVVVEAVEHHIEHGLDPRSATIAAMDQVSGPVIAVGLVLSAVFLPCAFIEGITGAFFRQFALTIAVSTAISTFNSLSLSPALTALLLRPREKHVEPPLPRAAFPLIGGYLAFKFIVPAIQNRWGIDPKFEIFLTATVVAIGAAALWIPGRWLNWLLGASFRKFNALFALGTRGYVRLVGGMLRVSVLVWIGYLSLVGVTWLEFLRVPSGFIPPQDMGFLMINVQLPDSASLDRTDAVMRKVEEIARPIPGVRHVAGIGGQSFVLSAAGSNFGSLFLGLKDYSLRRDPAQSSDAIANQLRGRFAKEIPDANIAVFGPPAVRGAGRAGGFAVMLEDRGDVGPLELQKQLDALVGQGSQTPGLLGLFSVFRANVPQLHIDPDPGACMMRGVSMADFAETLGVYEGSVYCNDYNLFGRTWQVVVQAEAPFRSDSETLNQLKVRNGRGGMVPIGSLAGQREVNGPLILSRYNMYPAASINGQAAPGVSSQQAIDIVERLCRRELPRSMAFEWTDMSFLQQQAGKTGMNMFYFAVLMVFLMLAAQYESWSLPLAVILVVPLCLLSALAGVDLMRKDMNIFTQVGFVVLVGLASKNAILIVEFARQQRLAGHSRRESTLSACRLRLRPIVMTSLAFILGVVPLLKAHGAGAEMRESLGIAVFSGMLGVTMFGVVLTPVFFSTIDSIASWRIFQWLPFRIVSWFLMELLTFGFVRAAFSAASQRLKNSHAPATGTAQKPPPSDEQPPPETNKPPDDDPHGE